MKRLFLLGVGIISISCFDCACGMNAKESVSLLHNDTGENTLGASLVPFIDASGCDESDLNQIRVLYSEAVDKSIFLTNWRCGKVLNAPAITIDNAAAFLSCADELNDGIESWQRKFESELNEFEENISSENSWLIQDGKINWQILNEDNENRSIRLVSGEETTLVDLAISSDASSVLEYLIYCSRNNINALDKNGRSFVNSIIEEGGHTLCDLAVKLIEKGYPFDGNDIQEECWYKLALFLSIDARSCSTATRKLLDAVTNVGGIIYGDTLLTKACRSNLKDVVVKLINKKADLRETDYFDNEPIHIAAAANNIELVRLLVVNGVSIEEPNKRGERPIHMAIEAGAEETVLGLIEMGANFISGGEGMQPPLQYVANRIFYIYMRSISGPSEEVRRFKDRLISSYCRIGKMLEEKGAKMDSDSRSAQLYEKMKKRYI